MSDNNITNPRGAEIESAFSEICERRYSRRDLLKAGAVVSTGLALSGLAGCATEQDTPGAFSSESMRDPAAFKSNYDFIEIEHGRDETHHVAPDHEAQILLRWGDPLFEDAPEFDVNQQTAAAQAQQFGYNNDYIGYLDLQPKGREEARALLCINHEYPIHGLMFPDHGEDSRASMTEEQVKISQAACGNSIVEVARTDGVWHVDRTSAYNRRITASQTEMQVTGPVAGHPRLRTNADPTGENAIGTMNNCAGGMTPWGTYLTCEENFNFHFGGKLQQGHPEAVNYKRYNLPTDLFNWSKFDPRFDVSEEPNEANRFGWVVEIDPLDPSSKPKKRTALGRFKHEGGENIVAADGRLVIYMGDDQRFEYLYKFVSRDKVNRQDRKANEDLLDHGTLYAAKFSEDGLLEWLPLTIDNAALAAQFESQADILIEPRRAADMLGATPMDRPEDVAPNPKTGKVYVMLTNNTKRLKGNVANPRANNVFGHIIEIAEMDNDHTASSGKWDMLVKCGDPRNLTHEAKWNPATSDNGWFASPDNAAIDPTGRLWVSTDQGPKTSLSGTNDGLWALETEGPGRGTGKMFFRVPMGAEMCGPIFSDDGESLFLAVQHPGDIDTKPGSVRIDTATTRWPDFRDDMPPRPSVVAVRKKGGGKIG